MHFLHITIVFGCRMRALCSEADGRLSREIDLFEEIEAFQVLERGTTIGILL